MKLKKEIENSDLYGGDFHATRDIDTRYAADRILSILYQDYSHFNKVIDVGCGIGTFLNVAKALGSKFIVGVDGDWVNRDDLVIPQEFFHAMDLNSPTLLDESYDLAISLEVAEHLPKESAERFVHWLCGLAPVILFSAAIPGQGGVGHKNEAWLSYWVELFRKEDFIPLDIIRPKIWDDDNIYFWYRQNIVVFSSIEKAPTVHAAINPRDLVHPKLYLSKLPKKSASLIQRLVRRVKCFIR
jgi:SAM-dependent methyltransferase